VEGWFILLPPDEGIPKLELPLPDGRFILLFLDGVARLVLFPEDVPFALLDVTLFIILLTNSGNTFDIDLIKHNKKNNQALTTTNNI
jgi:hypothetical protein